ncbi:MAG: sensor histidine kinase N-terminal domain-containing protein [Sedimentisphaerales bacterium]|nr:sensor histidine kinase N-terminal domain-containing protein [Sedimentisphaerales bacterium]
MIRSLRTRLLTGTIVGMMLLLTVFSLIIYTVIHSAVIKQFDGSLMSIAHILAASVELDSNEIELEFEVKQMPEFHNVKHPTYYQLWTGDGEAVARSPLLGTDDFFFPESLLGKPASYTQTFKCKRNGKSLRAVAIIFQPRNDDADPTQTNGQLLSLMVARDAGDLLGQLQFLRWLLLIASAAVALLSLLIAATIVRNGLAPLNTIAAEIATITEDNLTKRITTERVPEEIISIPNRLNELMSRLEASFNRERQFNADVAHELRTPLAGIRSTIEVTLTRNRDSKEYQDALSECLEITKTMQSMIGNLLIIAGLDAGPNNFHKETVHLAEIIDTHWKAFSEQALQRNITFNNCIDHDMTCEIDRQHLSIILSNVLQNAALYTNDGGTIWVAVFKNNTTVSISISNTGCGLTTEQITHVFDSFWRGDSSRTDTGVHCGLGLALVQKLTRALGGRANAELQSERIFVLQLNLPLKPGQQEH